MNSRVTVVGIKTENVDVTVRISDVLEKMLKRVIPTFADHLNKDGYWMYVTEQDYHRGDVSYGILRAATEQEIKLYEAILTLRQNLGAFE